MKINIDKHIVEIEGADYEDAYFLYKNLTISGSINELIGKTFVVKYDERFPNAINKLSEKDYRHDFNYITEDRIKLVHHCRIHNEFGANPKHSMFYFLKPEDEHIIVNKLVNVKDDKLLAVILDILDIMSYKEPYIEKSGKLLCMIIDFLIKDYKIEQYKSVYDYITDEYKERAIPDRVYNFLYAMFYRMFLEYDNDLVFINSEYREDNIPVRFQNQKMKHSEELSNKEKKLIKKKIEENYYKYHSFD